jgi:hypothetical protein
LIKNEDWEKESCAVMNHVSALSARMVNAGNAANLTKVNCPQNMAQAVSMLLWAEEQKPVSSKTDTDSTIGIKEFYAVTNPASARLAPTASVRSAVNRSKHK